MNLALTVLNITAPVFALAAIGFAWVKLGFEYRLEFVTRLAMTLSLPCLIFVALMTSDVEPAALAELTLASFAAYAAVCAAFFMIVRLCGLDRRTFLAPLIFGNTGNLGFPLALFAFGEAGLSYAVVVFAVMAILSFTIGIETRYRRRKWPIKRHQDKDNELCTPINGCIDTSRFNAIKRTQHQDISPGVEHMNAL